MATSGAVVTIRWPTSSTSASRVRTRPKASWVELFPEVTGPVDEVGIGSRGRGTGAGLLISKPARAQSFPAGLSGSMRSHSVSGVSPVAVRRSSICSGLSMAEWLRGLPAMGSPQPLTV